MNKTILYLQTSEEVSMVLSEKFDESEIEFIWVKSGEEALKVMSERDIMVALIDVFIPDMKLMDFIKESSKRAPETMLNVCIDITDPILIMNLSNIKQVKKLYLDSRDFKKISDGVKSSLDQVCITRDYNQRQKAFIDSEEAFNTHLNELKEAMVNQKNSYQKLGSVLNPYLEAMIELANEQVDPSNTDEERKQYIRLVKLSSEKLLRIMTTGGKFDTEHFSQMLKEELVKALPKSGRIRIENITDSVFGNQEKDKLSKMYFSLWLLTLYQGYRMKSAVVNINSYYLTASDYRFEITSKGDILKECPRIIREYAENIIRLYTKELTIDAANDQITYYLDFDLNNN